MSSRDINDLKPEIKMKALRFVELCKQKGIDILIVCTLRTSEEQDDLWQSGRTKAGKILTNLKGGKSKHNFGLAFDFCVLANGKCDWNNKDAFLEAGKIGESVGLLWAGRWTGKLKETGHFEV